MKKEQKHNFNEQIAKLNELKSRLQSDVVQAYGTRGQDFGRERFSSWKRQINSFLDEHFPGQSSRFNKKLQHMILTRGRSESDLDVFWRQDGSVCEAFIDSLIIDIKNGEFEMNTPNERDSKISENNILKSHNAKSNAVFIVHGHDDLQKINVARFLEKIGLETIILHEQASKGMTIIEKIEEYTNVGFAIVLYTSDDKGNSNGKVSLGELNNRARQNVVFEHGYLIAKLGRRRVIPLVAGDLELPSDVSGIVYIGDKNWELDVAKEIRAAGINIDMNKIC